MNNKSEQTTMNRTKNIHSLSANKLQFGEGLAISSIPNKDESEKFSRTARSKGFQSGSFGSILSPLSDTKRKNFYEIIGVSSVRDKNALSPTLKVEVSSPKISLTDFMGKNKYSLFKKTGFMEYYGEYMKNNEIQKIVEQKHTLSFPNIIHTDIMRKHAIKKTFSPRHTEISALFEKPKYGKQRSTERIDVIQKIIDQCDDLYKEGKKYKDLEKDAMGDMKKFSIRNNKRTRRLTVQEKFLIKKQIANS